MQKSCSWVSCCVTGRPGVCRMRQLAGLVGRLGRTFCSCRITKRELLLGAGHHSSSPVHRAGNYYITADPLITFLS